MTKLSIFFVSIILISANALAEEGGREASDLELSPEDFFGQDISVFSPAKKLQKLTNVPSAVYVLTEEDIERSAASSLPDLLRLVPGLQVAQVNSHDWAITSRGFNQEYGNKLLLLIDGTPAESLVFNGIFWSMVDVPLDIIKRIEVVRGPGAAIWGTRAVNGLINIITKDAFTYPQKRVQVITGNEETVSAYARGGKIFSPNAAIQSYAKYTSHDDSKAIDGAHDAWQLFTFGTRGDLQPTGKDNVRVNLTYTLKDEDFQTFVPSLAPPFSFLERHERDHYRINFSSTWDHTLDNTSEVNLELTSYLEERRDFSLDYLSLNTDLEGRYRFVPAVNQDLVLGVNLRFYSDQTEGTDFFTFVPQDRDLQFYRGFLHYEVDLLRDLLTLNLGARFEHNNQVNDNILPTARLLYKPSDTMSIWAAYSYTEGTTSRVFEDVNLDAVVVPDPITGMPTLITGIGNRNVESETLSAYEVGLWVEPLEKIYMSLTGFYFTYDDLLAREPGAPSIIITPFGPMANLPVIFANTQAADSWGIELASDYFVNNMLSLGLAYSFMDIDVDAANSADRVIESLGNNAPRHSASLRIRATPLASLESDFIVRYVDTLLESDIDSYIEGDAQLRYYVNEHFDVSLTGRNLFNDSHPEFRAITFLQPLSEVERSVYLSVRYTF